MPAGPAPGRTVEDAAREARDRLAAASAARWDPWLELVVPLVSVAAAVFGLAVAAGLLAVMSP